MFIVQHYILNVHNVRTVIYEFTVEVGHLLDDRRLCECVDILNSFYFNVV